MTENLKLKANTSGKGLGAIASYDSTWIAHHDDFADLLSALNKNKPNKEDDEGIAKEKASQVSLELKSKSLKRRIHYQKFTRAKDITEYDDNAKKAILGLGISKKDKQKKAEQNEEITKPESSDSVEISSQKHSISSVSAGDYYKDKMAAKLAALKEASNELIDQSKKKKKCTEEPVVDAQEELTMELGEEPKKKKKKRHIEEPDASQEEPLVELDEEPKKNKKKRHVEGDDVVNQEEKPAKKENMVKVSEPQSVEAANLRRLDPASIQIQNHGNPSTSQLPPNRAALRQIAAQIQRMREGPQGAHPSGAHLPPAHHQLLVQHQTMQRLAEEEAAQRADTPALPLRVQKLKQHLDLGRFVSQLERLLAQPIKIPGTSVMPGSKSGRPPSIFSVCTVWPNEAERIEHASQMHNFKNVKSRTWLKDLLVAESDSESEGELNFSEKDLQALLKIHRKRRDLQKVYHQDQTKNSQYKYYGAGLLSINDPFSDHQTAIIKHHPRT
ncbi:unnamed protein product, partial [Mesorhabditis belari]|uniref:Uncharacterized protein n=1 Tax=Mesorhabditis belari TaxID=2138241 RepID=A0AAF3J2E5_9BILA